MIVFGRTRVVVFMVLTDWCWVRVGLVVGVPGHGKKKTRKLLAVAADCLLLVGVCFF